MKKYKVIPIFFVIIMVVALLVSGCANPTPTSTQSTTVKTSTSSASTASTPTKTTASTTSGKKFELTLGSNESPTSINNEIRLAWVKWVEQDSGGRLKINVVAGGQAGSAAELYDNVRTHLIDLGEVSSGTSPGRFPLMSVFELPFVFEWPNARPVIMAYWDLIDKYPEFNNETKDVYAVPTYNRAANQIGSRNKPIHTLEDMKGMLIRATGQFQTESVKLLGATPASMPAGEMYDGLSKGVIDGVCNSLVSFVLNRKLYEVCNYYTQVDLNGSAGALVINLDTWNSLPPDLKKYFEPELYKQFGNAWGYINDQQEIEQWNFLDDYYKKNGYEGIYVPPKSERDRWVTAVQPIYDNWVMNAAPAIGEAKARQILNDAISFGQQNRYTEVVNQLCLDAVNTFGMESLLP